MEKLANIRNVLIILIVVLAAAFSTAQASAAPALQGTFEISGQPRQMTLGPDGNVWFTISGSTQSKEFGRITPDGTVTEYDTPNGKAVFGITAGPSVIGGPNDRIWMSQEFSVIKWNPATETGSPIPVPDLDGPRGLTVDDQSFVWAVDELGSLIRISAVGVSLEFPVGGSNGRGIAYSGSNLWWADFGQQKIHRSPRATPGAPTSFGVGGGPQEVAAGPDGQIAYTNPGNLPQTVGLISTAGVVNEVPVPATDPFGITFADDTAYWVANFASDDLTRLTPEGVTSAPIKFPAGSGPRYLTKGPDGTLWVALESSGRIAKVTGVKLEQPNGGNNDGNGNVAKLKLSAVKLKVGKKLTVKAGLNKNAKVTIKLDRKKGKRFVNVRSVIRKGTEGMNAFKLARPRVKGAYRIRVIGASGTEKSGPVIRKFRVS